ncbi:TetR/AcrR family transcriptional regulator [Georgenia yuyongxinii]|uniref:TetR/AcrR family transcriptional regulator n=1 Tax=Georgenia yuyongxinii TaxID=2589797 RepID=A0A552WT79_9MICO|nr:TetR/AcrR family transcriptional regulator [Georgenia yuyongxinii]TRW46050.1 TetR/AcrR family transcriptional regulator [Georgenia yuyongxinii]
MTSRTSAATSRAPGTGDHPAERAPLSHERVLRCALALADAQGIGALTMRSLAQELGVKPMSLYHHVANKEAILDGIVDLVFAEIELPSPGGDWRTEIRRRAGSAREVLHRHPWAVALMESRSSPGPASLRHHDTMLGTLRAAGFSVEMTGHAYALLDAFVYGHAIQEAGLPFTGTDDAAEITSAIAAQFAGGDYPHMVEFATERVLKPGYDFGDEFEFGLGVVLDALERLLPDGGA